MAEPLTDPIQEPVVYASRGRRPASPETTVLTARELGERLALSAQGVKRIPVTDLPYFTVGTRRDRRYEREDVERYIAARRAG